MKKLVTLRQVQMAKIIQFIIVYIGLIFILFNDSNLIFFIFLTLFWLIEWLVPKEYKGTRDPDQKTIFFHQMTPIKENIVMNIILFLATLFMIWLRYHFFP